MNAKVRTVRPLTSGPQKGPYMIEFANTKVSPTVQEDLSSPQSSQAYRSIPNPVNTGLRMIRSESLVDARRATIFACSSLYLSNITIQALTMRSVHSHSSSFNQSYLSLIHCLWIGVSETNRSYLCLHLSCVYRHSFLAGQLVFCLYSVFLSVFVSIYVYFHCIFSQIFHHATTYPLSGIITFKCLNYDKRYLCYAVLLCNLFVYKFQFVLY